MWIPSQSIRSVCVAPDMASSTNHHPGRNAALLVTAALAVVCLSTHSPAAGALVRKPPPCKTGECMTCTGECGACPAPPPPGVPSWQGCTTPLAQSLPYCDPSKTVDERLDWLVGNLTLVEKIRAISPQPYLGGTCGVHTCGKPSIGLPNYFWLTETNTAVAATCYHGDSSKPYHCSTTFPGPMNMGASFNKTSWRMKGDVIGTEMRAFNNIGQMRQSPGDYVGLTGFGPNINIARECVHRCPILSPPAIIFISDPYAACRERSHAAVRSNRYNCCCDLAQPAFWKDLRAPERRSSAFRHLRARNDRWNAN